MFCKKGFLKILLKFTGRQLCLSLFSVPRDCKVIKKRLQHRCFPVNFAKILRELFLSNTSRWILLKSLIHISCLQCWSWCFCCFHFIRKQALGCILPNFCICILPWIAVFVRLFDAFQKYCFICFNESLLKVIKNAFYFTLKALFVLKIFLSWIFGHVEKTAWLKRYG